MDKVAKPAVIETRNGWAMARDDEGICAVSSPAGDYIELRGNSFTMRMFRKFVEGLLDPSSGFHPPAPAEKTRGDGVTDEMLHAAIRAFRVPDELARSGRRVGKTAAALKLALEAAMAVASRQAVPDGRTPENYEQDQEGQIDGYSWGHHDGWNDCRKAMIASVPLAARGNVQ